MSSGISNIINSRLRLTGLSSGIDTESMIQKLMSVERMKVDRVSQNKQLLEWKRDEYRSITNLLRSFKDEYFNFLKPATNMRSASSLSSFKATYNGTDTSSILTATAGSSTKAGTYTISNVTIAKAAKASGSSIAGSTTAVDEPDLNISNSGDNNKISIMLNGVSKEIVIGDIPANIDVLVTDLQSKINQAFGSGKITVGKSVDNKLTFDTSNTNTMSIDYSYNSGLIELIGKDLKDGITLTSQNNKFKMTLDGNTVDIILAERFYANTGEVTEAIQAQLDMQYGSDKVRALNQNGKITLKAVGEQGDAIGPLGESAITPTSTISASNKTLEITIGNETKIINLDEKDYTRDELLSAIQAKMNAAFGTGKTMVSLDETEHLRFEGVSDTAVITTAMKENGGLAALKLVEANRSNKISLDKNLADIKGMFGTPLSTPDSDGDGYDIEFSINGKEFQFKSSETTMGEIFSIVNSDSTANVKMQYDQINDRITIESKKLGVTEKVQISSIDGNFMNILGLDGTNVTGSDASMIINMNDGTGEQTIIRSTNNFSINGVAFVLKKDTEPDSDPIEVNIVGDSEKTFDLIVKFIDKYNEVIGKITDEFSERRPRTAGSTGNYYLPLTNEQKQAMKDEDVKRWEEAAKTGLLRGDHLLGEIFSDMRRAVSDVVSGISGSLASIGISTKSYDQKGMLVIDEDRLKSAIKDDPQKVIDLFTRDSDIMYSADLKMPERTERYKQTGIANRLLDIIEDNIRTIRDSNGRKGFLLEKAGIQGDLTELHSVLSKEIAETDKLIDNYNEKLLVKENYYYAKFAAMETLLGQMNSQSAWLAQQFGGG